MELEPRPAKRRRRDQDDSNNADGDGASAGSDESPRALDLTYDFDRDDGDDKLRSDDDDEANVYVPPEFEADDVTTDVVLVVEGTKLHVSRAVLALQSPVFRALFQSDFREKNMREIELPEKNVKDFVQFLMCIYPSIMAPVSDTNVYRILPLASEYQVDRLIMQCEDRLIMKCSDREDLMSHTELLEMMQLAEKYSLMELLYDTISIAAKRFFRDIKDSISDYKISAETKERILKKRVERLESIFDGGHVISRILSMCNDLTSTNETKRDCNNLLNWILTHPTYKSNKSHQMKFLRVADKFGLTKVRDDMISRMVADKKNGPIYIDSLPFYKNQDLWKLSTDCRNQILKELFS